MKTFLSFGIMVSVLFGFTSYIHAAADAQITLSPRNPEPGSSVLLTLTSYSIDIDNSVITWKINGEEVLKGYGEKRLTIQAGGAGQVTEISARADSDDGSYASVALNLVPQSVSLLYETPESYVPLFYKGRSLPGEGAVVKFVAVGNITDARGVIRPENLTYNWYINDEFKELSSGRGKQVAYLPLDILTNKNEIKVVARSAGGVTASKTITVYPHPILPMLYTYDQLFGVDYTKAISRRYETAKSFVLAFEPFYYSRNGSLIDYTTIDWSLDGLPVTPFGGKKLLLEPKKGSFGSNSLAITLSHSKRRLQKARAELDIIYDTR